MIHDLKEKLISLYAEKSKHSNYQVLPEIFNDVIRQDEVTVKSRYERERWDYILSNLDFKQKSVIDIGGNTGFFSFEAINAGAKEVHYYEGNESHAEFVDTAAKCFGLENNFDVNKKYYLFNEMHEVADVTLLLNVIHHLGDDYASAENIDTAKNLMADEICMMAYKTKIMVFQMGFNWKGNVNLPLFTSGTKGEMIDFIKKATEDSWKIENIGIAERIGEKVEYRPLNEKNIKRDDSMGEFLNRPIFIMKSKR